MDPIDEANDKEDDKSNSASTVSKRGRPRIPESWSRVISLNHDNLDTTKIHNLAIDLMMAPNLAV